MDRRAAKELLHIEGWLTLAEDLPAWKASLKPLFAAALKAVAADDNAGK